MQCSFIEHMTSRRMLSRYQPICVRCELSRYQPISICVRCKQTHTSLEILANDNDKGYIAG